MSYSKNKSINEIIKISFKNGNSIVEVSHSWSQMDKVIYMKFPMDSYTKSIALTCSDLTYYKSEGSPHNKPDEGFYSNLDKIAISFPLK